MSLKDDVLARVDIAELIGQYIAVKPAGREFKACCPFHEEKTPSFHVNPEKGLYHCFGCKAGGSVIDFVMRIENLEFKEALEWLARRYNIEIHYEPGQQREQSLKEQYRKINEAAAKFFRNSLKAPAGEVARQYLDKRGISERLASEFDLGYAPREWSALGDMLMEHGAQSQMLITLGLIKQRSSDSGYGQEGRGWYDAFRHRLIFPIRSATGEPIAFAGRSLSDEDKPKYLNVTNTPLYDKSKTLYNLDRAKGLMRDAGAVIVEGYMDVIGLASAGISNTVATCGTAMTAEHVKLLRRYTDRFYLAFDGDEAGRKAAWSAGVLFLSQGFDAKVIDLPAGVDPDDLVREKGEAAWQALLSSAKGVVAFWLAHQQESHPTADVMTQRQWVQQLAPLYARIPDELIRQQFTRDVASALRLGAAEVSGLLNAQGGPMPQRRGKDPGRAQLAHETRQRALLQGILPTEREVMRRLLDASEFRELYQAVAVPEWFSDQRFATMYSELTRLNDAGALINHESFSGICAELLTAEPLRDGNEQLMSRHHNEYLKRQAAEVYSRWEEANRTGDEGLERELHLEYLELKRQIQQLNSIGG